MAVTGLDAKSFLGCQVWLEPNDSRERVDYLFQMMQESGLGWARIFLMWPFIEAKPNVWDFTVFDHAFAAAAKYDIRIKATLTANSGPYYIGTPSVLHSGTGFLSEQQRKPMERYITTCVNRYKGHPALGQWILWNEPTNGADRTEESLRHWQQWLKNKYHEENLERLNERWRTGYASFENIPFPEDVPHGVHQGNHWNSYGPWLEDWQSRSDWLISELRWVLEIVKQVDPHTETCVNPQPLLSSMAKSAIDLGGMGELVDVVGASYHPAWMFTFADRSEFPALMASGVRLQYYNPFVKKGEVTEVQTGNTLNSSTKPCEASPSEIAQFYFSSLAVGASSVTGWCFNVRSRDFEAGDWGLLDDLDLPSERSKMMRKIHDRLSFAFERTGAWAPVHPKAWVASDPRSQAIEWIEDRIGMAVPGRLANDGAHGAALLSSQLLGCGINAGMARVDHLCNGIHPNGLLVLSHHVAWNKPEMEQLLSFVQSGATLLFDATSGRKNLNAELYRPWPGGIAEHIGMRARGLQTRPQGYEMTLNGLDAGKFLLTRMDADFDPNAGWRAWREIRFKSDHEPCIFERDFGKGKIVFVNGIMGPTLVHEKNSSKLIQYILQRVGEHLIEPVSPITSATFTIPVKVEKGSLTVVITPTCLERQGQNVRLYAQEGRYTDLWTGELVQVCNREVCMSAKDGISLLWKDPN